MSMLSHELQALSLLAHAQRLQGQPLRAARLLQAVDQLHPGDGGVLRALAAAELAADQPRRALEALERLALAGAAPDMAFHLLRAQALVALGRDADAQAAMRSAQDLRGGAVT